MVCSCPARGMQCPWWRFDLCSGQAILAKRLNAATPVQRECCSKASLLLSCDAISVGDELGQPDNGAPRRSSRRNIADSAHGNNPQPCRLRGMCPGVKNAFRTSNCFTGG